MRATKHRKLKTRASKRVAKKSRDTPKLWISLKILAIVLLFFIMSTIDSNAKLTSYVVKYSGSVIATAFNSEESQTDSTPWTTALGTRCRKGVIASNFLPFGTKMKIDGFGNQIFVVEDRMNKRFSHRVDIWFKNHNDAMKFGVRKIKYHVLKAA